MGWLDYLEGLLRCVAEGQAGQAGTVIVGPPDDRQHSIQLTASAGFIGLLGDPAFIESVWPPEKAKDAVSAYVAAVEGAS